MSNTRIVLRVTSVWSETNAKSIFVCVAVNGDGENVSVSKYFVVHVKHRDIPLPIQRGQIWKVTGFAAEREVVKNNVIMTEVIITASKLIALLPEGENAFMKLISYDNEFQVIGERLALKIWIKFGKEIYKVLEDGALNQLLLMKGMGIQSARSLIQGWHKYKNLKHIAWFDKYEIPSGIAMRLIKHHQDDSLKAVEEDPYRLISFGLTFTEADNLAQKSFGFDDDSTERLLAAVEIAQNVRMSKGHTVSTHNDIFPTIEKTLGSSELAEKALSLGYSNAAFFIGQNGLYHSMSMWVMESVVAKRLSKLSVHETWTHHYDEALSKSMENLPFPMTERQDDAVITSFSRGASVIAGGAGTGKTTVLRVVLGAYNSLGAHVKAMALSGRATKRITESTGYYAQTIASFLSKDSIEANEKAVVVIDEASMVDLPTMFRIVTQIPKSTRIILVGDPDQLSPIGTGKVLHDVVDVIPTTTLDIVKRQARSTGIPELSAIVRDGQIPTIREGANIRHHQVPKHEINQKVTELYAANPEVTQVVAAKYSGDGGIDAINEMCQNLCNPLGQRLEFEICGVKQHLNIRQGDPVIFTENNWKRGVQNGTMGLVQLVGKSETAGDDDEFAIADIKLDDGTVIPLTADLWDSIRPAYGVSLHKAQGSQFKRVIIPVINLSMLDRSWIYTAITRAEIEIELVGTEKDFHAAIKRKSTASKRDTYLKSLLVEEINKLTSAQNVA